jgi:hypothetical protein
MSHPEEAERPRLSQVGRKERRAQRLKNIRLRERAKIPGDIGPGVAPAPAAPAPVAPAPVVAAPQPSAWWMDPKILALGAAAVLILMRRKKS